MTTGTQKMRLDQAMVERHLAVTRSRARDAILRGLVKVDGRIVDKPAALVAETAALELLPGSGLELVSRGALKLAGALSLFRFDAAGRIGLDVGASTGGFTEVLLSGGAARVYAVDVGRDQLHRSLRTDPRVVVLEETDARALTRDHIPEAVKAIVADVSFISLAKALPAALALAAPGCWLVALVKPQFEAGPEHVGKDGIVRDVEQRKLAVERVAAWLTAQGWRVLGNVPSPIAGGAGNQEFLIGAVRDA